jgi:hypothetical protein
MIERHQDHDESAQKVNGFEACAGRGWGFHGVEAVYQLSDGEPLTTRASQISNRGEH